MFIFINKKIKSVVFLTSQEKINLFQSLFRGRNDVFAKYWERADKSMSGYSPVCANEWKTGVCNKLQKKKCKDCSNSIYSIFSAKNIEEHLRGYKIYGIYPLLDDNTSYFVAVDFDGENWSKSATELFIQCQKYNIPAYLERSRSGNGCHLWVFFTDRYPAIKSRNIMTHLLREAKIIDEFSTEDSFDRLFPNQDSHNGKGFGNLIALPLQKQAQQQNNTVFLDPKNNLEPYSDQWDFLKNVQKISAQELDLIYSRLNSESVEIPTNTDNFLITIKEKLIISKIHLSKTINNYLRENLNFINSEFIVKKRIGLSVYKTEKYFKLIEQDDNNVYLPRGFLPQLTNFLSSQKIGFKIIDKRDLCDAIEISNHCQLFSHQKEAVENLLNAQSGVLVAPPGSGKTVIGIELINRLKQPTLILVHKKQIFNQWAERIENFLNIPKKEIGQFGTNKKTIGDKVTIAMIQTLNRENSIETLKSKAQFGLILVDECHHIPAQMFRQVITQFSPYYLYGLTATPERKNNDEKLIYLYLGEILHTINSGDLKNSGKNQTPTANNKIIIKNTSLNLPFNIKTKELSLLSKIITFDSERNQQIINDVEIEAKKSAKCLILTERKEHVEILDRYLKEKFEIVALTGDLTDKQRREKIQQIASQNFQIIIATGQLIGEGTDIPNLDCLFLVYPFSFKGKLIQYIGRIQRGDSGNKTIYDYHDINIPYLEKLFKKRKGYYKKYFDWGEER